MAGPSGVEVLGQGPGGRRVVRSDDVVIRPCYPSSPSVHRLLRHLEEGGFTGAPRFLGTDGSNERCSYIPGRSGPAGWGLVVDDEGLAAVARLLHRYHDAVTSYEPPPDDEWSSGARGGGGPGEVILHGDPGPWNVVWDDAGHPIALIDWDHANPGEPLDDLAYLAAYAAPLAADDDEAMTWMRHPQPPDRRHRLEVIADGYGTEVAPLVDRAAAVMAKTNRTVERMARLGLEPQRTWATDTKLRRLWARQARVMAARASGGVIT